MASHAVHASLRRNMIDSHLFEATLFFIQDSAV
jgi:hypothetical protein